MAHDSTAGQALWDRFRDAWLEVGVSDHAAMVGELPAEQVMFCAPGLVVVSGALDDDGRRAAAAMGAAMIAL